MIYYIYLLQQNIVLNFRYDFVKTISYNLKKISNKIYNILHKYYYIIYCNYYEINNYKLYYIIIIYTFDNLKVILF